MPVKTSSLAAHQYIVRFSSVFKTGFFGRPIPGFPGRESIAKATDIGTSESAPARAYHWMLSFFSRDLSIDANTWRKWAYGLRRCRCLQMRPCCWRACAARNEASTTSIDKKNEVRATTEPVPPNLDRFVASAAGPRPSSDHALVLDRGLERSEWLVNAAGCEKVIR